MSQFDDPNPTGPGLSSYPSSAGRRNSAASKRAAIQADPRLHPRTAALRAVWAKHKLLMPLDAKWLNRDWSPGSVFPKFTPRDIWRCFVLSGGSTQCLSEAPLYRFKFRFPGDPEMRDVVTPLPSSAFVESELRELYGREVEMVACKVLRYEPFSTIPISSAWDKLAR